MGSPCLNTMCAPKSKSFYFAFYFAPRHFCAPESGETTGRAGTAPPLSISRARIRVGQTARRYVFPAKADSLCTVYGRHCLDMRQEMGLEIAEKAHKWLNGVKNGKKTTVRGHF